MTMPFHISGDSITVFNRESGTVRTIRSGTKFFARVRRALLNDQFAVAWKLMDLKETVTQVSEGAGFKIENGVVQYGGMVLNDVISQKLIAVIMDGATDCGPIQRYIGRILKNPSRSAANELYDFLGYRELPITPEGKVLAWKGVQDNYYSVMGNTKTVVLQGTVDKGGHILNKVGATIEVERICVDDDRTRECSFGLHCGSYNYAKSWGKRLLLVEFDPADAVAVPTDCQFQKLRVCKYTVIAEMTGKDEIREPMVDSKTFKPEKRAGKTLHESLAESLELGYNLFNDKDFDNIVANMVKDAGVENQTAIEAVLQARVEKIGEKIKTYLSRKGKKGAIVKQIQSMLKMHNMTCEEIVDGYLGTFESGFMPINPKAKASIPISQTRWRVG